MHAAGPVCIDALACVGIDASRTLHLDPAAPHQRAEAFGVALGFAPPVPAIPRRVAEGEVLQDRIGGIGHAARMDVRVVVTAPLKPDVVADNRRDLLAIRRPGRGGGCEEGADVADDPFPAI